MKIGRILPVVGIATLLACGAAFSQSPQIPPGAGVGVDRQPPGSRFRNPTNPPGCRSAVGDKSWQACDRAELLAAGRRQGLAR